MRIKSKNGRDLYQGQFFNWSIEPIYQGQALPEVYMIWLDDINNQIVHFYYYPDSNIFQIAEHKFHIPDITKAEEIIKSFIGANGTEIPPLFKHVKDERKEKLDEIMTETPEYDD